MAIVRVEGSGEGSERERGLAAAKKAVKKGAKKGAKHAIEKHAAKKHAIEKHAAKKSIEKHAGKKAAKHAFHAAQEHEPEAERSPGKLEKAYHHLQRAATVISLVEKGSGGDLRSLLEQGLDLYRRAAEPGARKELARQAVALLGAVEHLALAGLYSARIAFRVDLDSPPARKVEKRLRELKPRLEDLGVPTGVASGKLLGAAWELLRRADAAEDDAHLQYELAMAADGLCEALEEGFGGQ